MDDTLTISKEDLFAKFSNVNLYNEGTYCPQETLYFHTHTWFLKVRMTITSTIDIKWKPYFDEGRTLYNVIDIGHIQKYDSRRIYIYSLGDLVEQAEKSGCIVKIDIWKTNPLEYLSGFMDSKIPIYAYNTKIMS
ncbi:Hypothetical protein HVR_LOCUS425 [uncultured virus]|nr:Hypothetical protein HVR_LOCUS425 [uncultured virus]